MSDVRLTPEVREKLISRLPFSTKATIEFIPPCFQVKDSDGAFIIPERYQAVFTVRSMTRKETNDIRALAMSDKKDDQKYRDCVRPCIVGWKNLFDAGSMEEIAYTQETTGGASKEIFDQFPSTLFGDLLTYVGRISGIIDTEKLGL